MNIDFCEKYNMLPHGGIVLCAVSGGKDSMCLLKELCEIAPSYGFSVSCAHFNHCLRGADSDGDMAFVKSYCAERDIPCYVGSADVAAFRAKTAWEQRKQHAFYDTPSWKKRRTKSALCALQPRTRR
ncbi:MAG: ATP-binding protein, partial [Oscillospiraceae bacterium]